MKIHARTLIRLIKENVSEYPRMGAEIGVWRGGLSADLLRTFPFMYLVAVDNWSTDLANKGSSMPKSVEEVIAAKNEFYESTAFANGRRIVLEFDSKEARRCAPSHLDFIFIDACHLYESVRQDLEFWYPKLMVGGLFCGHDYNNHRDRVGGYGVKRAVTEWAEKNGKVIRTAPGSIWWTKKNMSDVRLGT